MSRFYLCMPKCLSGSRYQLLYYQQGTQIKWSSLLHRWQPSWPRWKMLPYFHLGWVPSTLPQSKCPGEHSRLLYSFALRWSLHSNLSSKCHRHHYLKATYCCRRWNLCYTQAWRGTLWPRALGWVDLLGFEALVQRLIFERYNWCFRALWQQGWLLRLRQRMSYLRSCNHKCAQMK